MKNMMLLQLRISCDLRILRITEISLFGNQLRCMLVGAITYIFNYAQPKVTGVRARAHAHTVKVERAVYQTRLETVCFLHRVAPFPINYVTVSSRFLFFAQVNRFRLANRREFCFFFSLL